MWSGQAGSKYSTLKSRCSAMQLAMQLLRLSVGRGLANGLVLASALVSDGYVGDCEDACCAQLHHSMQEGQVQHCVQALGTCDADVPASRQQGSQGGGSSSSSLIPLWSSCVAVGMPIVLLLQMCVTGPVI
jgi:hypothetical protein